MTDDIRKALITTGLIAGEPEETVKICFFFEFGGIPHPLSVANTHGAKRGLFDLLNAHCKRLGMTSTGVDFFYYFMVRKREKSLGLGNLVDNIFAYPTPADSPNTANTPDTAEFPEGYTFKVTLRVLRGKNKANTLVYPSHVTRRDGRWLVSQTPSL